MSECLKMLMAAKSDLNAKTGPNKRVSGTNLGMWVCGGLKPDFYCLADPQYFLDQRCALFFFNVIIQVIHLATGLR